jgi:acetyl-CoA carboxylase biotin carboxylase subunit
LNRRAALARPARPPVKKVLVANRGEIAIRVMRTCKELGLATVAVYSEADRSALHTRFADQAVLRRPCAFARELPRRFENILAAAKQLAPTRFTQATASSLRTRRSCAPARRRAHLHRPAGFERDGRDGREDAGARQHDEGRRARRAGDHRAVRDRRRGEAFVRKVGYPVMLKAAGGGGGKGMRRGRPRRRSRLGVKRAARSEALSAFGNDSVYLEKFLEQPHHIEIQVFADTHGNCIHLNERECSAQRRNQKVVEETPSPFSTPTAARAMGEVAVKAAKAVGYVGAGTVEFLVDASRNFYFLEMNTRLQVEHPVTEWVTGIDLVAWQLHVAQGGVLPLARRRCARAGTRSRCASTPRIRVELHAVSGPHQRAAGPSGPGVRDDSGVYAGYTVPTTTIR